MYKILVIDDEPLVTTYVKRGLERDGMYEVHTVNDSAAALGTARRLQPDVILLDILMPGANGGQIAAKINADSALAQVPIVFLTAIVDKKETGPRGLSTGGRRVVAKPATIAELKAVIEITLREAGLAPPTVPSEGTA